MLVLLASSLLLAAMAGSALCQSSQLKAPDFDGGIVPKDDAPKPMIVDPQRAPTPRPVQSDPCEASINEHDGIVSLTVDDSARSDSTTTFTLDGHTYGAQFDHVGHLQAEAPMLHRLGELAWDGSGKQKCYRHGIVFSNYQTIFEIALISDGRADALALHVVEPSGRVGGPLYYLSPTRQNADLSYALGQLKTYGVAMAGTSRVELYSLPADRAPGEGTIYAFVEFAGRGNPAHAPFCGDDPASVVSYEIDRLESGSMERRKGRFGAVTCGTAWAGQPEESGYFQMWKYKL